MRPYAKAEALCEANAPYRLAKPKPIHAKRVQKTSWGDPVMRARLANAYVRAGGDDEKAARILGVTVARACTHRKGRKFLATRGKLRRWASSADRHSHQEMRPRDIARATKPGRAPMKVLYSAGVMGLVPVPVGQDFTSSYRHNDRRCLMRVSNWPIVALVLLVATGMVSPAALHAQSDRTNASRSTWQISYQQQSRLRSRKPLKHRTRHCRNRAKARRPILPETNLPPNLGPGVGLGL